MRAHVRKRIAWIAAMLLVAAACRRTEVRARCTVRTAGSYCTFLNAGTQNARGCFRVTVGPVAGFVVYATAHVCSPLLQPGERAEATPITFDADDPFERCTAPEASPTSRA